MLFALELISLWDFKPWHCHDDQFTIGHTRTFMNKFATQRDT